MELIDYAVIAAYFAVVIYIGYRAKKSVHDSEDFFLSGRSLPASITGLAYMAANLGSFELMGFAANGAKYGMFTNQLYWIGSVPAMIFCSLVMVRFFYTSKARSVPEYLRLRFDEKTRGLNAFCFAVLTILTSGLSLYGLAVVFHALFGWSIDLCIWLSASTVLTYVFWGGLRASIYAEVLQFFLIVAGVFPLSAMVLSSTGGLAGLLSQVPVEKAHTWVPVLDPATSPYGEGVLSLIVGLGIASFAYWSTDFLVVQRALAARDLDAAKKTPLIAAFPKMLFPILTVVPGLAALLVIPEKIEGNYNMVLPEMILHYYPAGLLGLGVTALLSSFMSGMAGNVTAFNTVWTYDIYQSYFAPDRTDQHYLRVGRLVTVIGIVIAVGTAYSAMAFENLFDYWALLSAIFVGTPFATFILGVFSQRINGTAAFLGMVVGIVVGIGHYFLYQAGYLSYGSVLAMDFWGAAYGFFANLAVAWTWSYVEGPPRIEQLRGLVYGLMPDTAPKQQPWYYTPAAWAVAATVLMVALNLRFW